MKSILRFIKKALGIFFLIGFICYVILAFTDLREYPLIALFACLFTGGMAYLLLRRPKNAISNEDALCLKHRIIKMLAILWTIFSLNGILTNFKNYGFCDYIAVALFVSIPYMIMWRIYKNPSKSKNSTKNEVTNSTTDAFTMTYVEDQNMIYRADGKPISDEEVPYLIEITKQQALERCKQTPSPRFRQSTREELAAKWKAPQIIRCIQESYQIMLETDNPQTLCDRYKFSMTNFEELLYYVKQGYFDNKVTIDAFREKLSSENYSILICQCYQKYKNKAYRELKTQNGINNRINKFWKIIQDNVDENTYLELRKFSE